MHDRYLQVFPRTASIQPVGHQHCAALILDQQGVVRNCSQRLLRLLGKDAQSIKGQPMARFFPDFPIRPETPGYNRAFTAFWQNHGVWRQRVAPQGGKLQQNVETTVSVVTARKPVDEPMILVGLRFTGKVDTDDNDLERLEKRAESSSKAIMVTDDQGIIAYVNPAFERITGYSQAEAAGRPASLIKSGLHEHGFYMDLWAALAAGQEFQAVFANRRKNGEIYFEEKHIRPFVDQHGKATYFIAVGHPVSEYLQSTLLRLARLANHDPLTELPNRNLFFDRLRQHCSRAARYGTRFALAYLDLDNFKTINDTRGHDAGDVVLQSTAKHILNSLREEDTVGRLGGDEFGLILSNTQDESDVIRTLEKVLAALSLGAHYEGDLLPIKASIGAILYPDGGKDPESMMREADRIMYRCKLDGGNGMRLYCADGKTPPSLEGILPPLPLFPQAPANNETKSAAEGGLPLNSPVPRTTCG